VLKCDWCAGLRGGVRGVKPICRDDILIAGTMPCLVTLSVPI